MKLNNPHTQVLLALLGVWIASPPLHAEEGNQGPEIYYKEGIHIDSPDGANTIHIQGRVQGRYTWDGKEDAEDGSTFAIQRGKIKIEGNAITKNLKFGFQMNLATKAKASTTKVCKELEDSDGDGEIDDCVTASVVTKESDSGVAMLEDYYLDYKHSDLLGIKAGQYKVPFLFQELTSSGKQQFVDRSLATDTFNLKRDIGLDLHGGLFDGKLNYDLFLMNGDGANSLNRNSGFMAGGRLHLPILGMYEAYESDVNDSDEPNLGMGLAYAFNEATSDIQSKTIKAGTKISNGTIDLGFKYKGLSVLGALMGTKPNDGSGMTNWGYNAQVGLFLVPKTFEIATRTSSAIFSEAQNQSEYALGLNYFIKKHTFKIQTDYAYLTDVRGEGLNDHRVRSQIQLVF